MYGALDVRFFPNKRLNVDLGNIEIRVSHHLNITINIITYLFLASFWFHFFISACFFSELHPRYEALKHNVFMADYRH